MNKEGFSLVELLAVIVILAIIGSIAVVGYTAIINKTETKSYVNYEETLKSGAIMYLMDNGYKNKITINELIEKKKVERFNNPKSSDQCLNSYVLVSKDLNDDTNYTYKVCLICPEYKSTGC